MTKLRNRLDPVQSLLAVGTVQGRLFVFGKPGVQLSWDLGYPSKIRHLAFRAGSGFLVAIGECGPAPSCREALVLTA